MGNFDAGSIEAKLTLDRSQFKRELEAARAQAKAFEANDIEGKVNLDVDEGKALAEVEAFKAELASIPDKKTTTVDIKRTNGVSGTQLLITGILSALPLIPALAAPATAAVLGLSASLVAAGGGAVIMAAGFFNAFQAWSKAKAAHTQMTGSMAVFNTAMTGLTKAWNDFGKATQNQAFTVMAQGLKIVTDLLPRLTPIFSAFATVASGALTGLGNWFNGPEGKGMLTWFQTFGAQQFGVILSIVGNLARTILGLLQAFSPFATTMMNGLAGITASWAAWAQTVSQSQGFKDFMAYVAQVGPMVIDALMSLGRAIVAIGVAVAPLAPPLLQLITYLGNFISAMDPGTLREIVVVIAAIAAGFTLFEAAASLVAGTIAFFNGVMAVGSAIMTAYTAVVGAFAAEGIVVRTATMLWTAAQWLLNAALLANPIGIVVVLIAALVAAIILAWQHSETFRNIVTSAWLVIKSIVGQVVSFVIGLLHQLASDMVTTWNQIRSVVTTVAGAVKNAVVAAWNFIRSATSSAWNAIRSVISTVWNAIRSAVIAASNAIRSAVVAAWNAIRAAVSAAMNAIRSLVVAAWNGIRSVVISVSNAIRSAVISAWNAIRSGISSAVNAVRSVVSSGFNAARSAAVSAFNALRSGVTSAINGVRSAVSGVVGFIKGIFAGAGGWLLGAGSAIIGGLISGIRNGIGALGGVLGGIGGFIASHKGPPSYDKVMLKPHGRWIMGGLINSILSQVPELGRAMNTVTQALVPGRPTNLGLGGAGTGPSAGMGGGSSVQITQHIYNPVREPSSVTATRGIKDLAVLGVFN